MTRIGVLSVALLASLVASYMTWTAVDDGGAEDAEVAVYAASESELQTLAYTSEELDVTVERRSDDRGPYVWVTTVERKDVPVVPAPGDDPKEEEAPADDAPAEPEDGTAEDAPPEEPKAETRVEETTSSFRGNDDADAMWASFAPLAALRELDPSGASSDIFGFDEPTGTLAVTRRSGVVELTFGGETYGSKDRYVRANGKTYLVDDAKLRPLLFAGQRLTERRLQPLGEVDIETVVVVADGVTGEFVQKNADDRAKAYWARAATPEATDENAGLWLGKVFKLRLVEYVAEAPAGLAPAFTVTVSGKGESWAIEVLRDGDVFYARSEFDRSLVKLTQSTAAEAVADLQEVLGE